MKQDFASDFSAGFTEHKGEMIRNCGAPVASTQTRGGKLWRVDAHWCVILAQSLPRSMLKPPKHPSTYIKMVIHLVRREKNA